MLVAGAGSGLCDIFNARELEAGISAPQAAETGLPLMRQQVSMTAEDAVAESQKRS
jgi:hypothetical protein